MRAKDSVRLRHMRDAARTGMRLADGRARADLNRDEGLVLALVKAVEIIGEAASRVSESTRNEMPSVPWGDIVAMRNRLVHVYFDIDLDILWSTVQEDLPALAAALEPIVPADPE